MRKYLMFILFSFLIFSSCKNRVKVIAPASSNTEQPSSNISTGIFDTQESIEPEFIVDRSQVDEVHKVNVLEVLPTDKYVYLRVKENADEYWIATQKQEVQVGENYFYKSGLLKTNFESKEYNRTFEKIFLVSNIVPENHSSNQSIPGPSNGSEQIVVENIEAVPGSIAIKEIVNNPEKYKGAEIQISGICTKLNANIMNRNWIHLKDGTMDEYDFVITSEHPIPVGRQVTMKGTVSLDVDFGSGYRYDILIENGHIVR